MKVLHVSTLSTGGAFNAAFRLHEGLIKEGVDSSFLVLRNPEKKDINVFPEFSRYGLSVKKRLKNKLNLRKLNAVRRQDDFQKLRRPIEAFSAPFTDYALGKFIAEQIKPDIINLHWCANFIDYREFFSAIQIPVVWTLHDEQPFSAYWHYSNDQVKSEEALRLERQYLKTKKEALQSFKSKLAIVAPSQWLLDQSKKSELFKDYPHHLIRYGLDTDVFKRVSEMPHSFRLNKSAKVRTKLLFICQSVSNPRKGMQLLIEALIELDKEKYQLIAVGDANDEVRRRLSDSTIYTGSISDERELVRIYNFCDAMVIPSLQDNLPNTMLESLCCGTPVIGTPAGGIAEILKNPVFGNLCETPEAVSLAKAISSFSRDVFERNKIAEWAHEAFHLKRQAIDNLSLYRALLNEKKI